MNHIVARSVIRRLINTQKCNQLHISFSPINAFRLYDDMALMRLRNISGGAHVFETRMMSGAGEKKAVKGKGMNVNMVSKENNKDGIGSQVSVTSYWGVTRPKVKREDGSDWPWNCFMVRNNLVRVLAPFYLMRLK